MSLVFDARGSRLDADGCLVLPARIARTGVQEYPTGNEYRSPKEVFDAASMASFEGAPITIGHVAWIDSKNVEKLAVGYARNVHRDGDHLAADLVLFDAHAIARVQSKELVELSAGYDCDYGLPGLYEGVTADPQRNIRANHVALLPRGGARCGSSCSVSYATA